MPPPILSFNPIPDEEGTEMNTKTGETAWRWRGFNPIPDEEGTEITLIKREN